MSDEQFVIVIAAIIHSAHQGTGYPIENAVEDARHFIALAQHYLPAASPERAQP